jgi:enoyl-CoA hydratase
LDDGKRNVLKLEAIQELKNAFSADADAPVVVLSGRAGAFCSGLDNSALTTDRREREEILTAMGELLLAAVAGPTRIVAVCEGHAVAAGAMLLLVADLRIGARGAYKIGFTEPRMGMPLPELPALLARQRLDRRRLHELTVLGRTIDPESAAAVGFLDELVGSDELQAVALERANEIAGLSEAAYRGTIASVWGPTIERMTELVEAQARRRDAISGEMSTR